jgi:hypothetical protein
MHLRINCTKKSARLAPLPACQLLQARCQAYLQVVFPVCDRVVLPHHPARNHRLTQVSDQLLLLPHLLRPTQVSDQLLLLPRLHRLTQVSDQLLLLPYLQLAAQRRRLLHHLALVPQFLLLEVLPRLLRIGLLPTQLLLLHHIQRADQR